MNKVVPIILLCSVAVITTLVLSSCGGNNTASIQKKTNQQYLTAFMSLHNQYCEKKYASSENLKRILDGATNLKPAKNFEGVYEILINNVSFAVSPEEEGCTTDVMLQSGDKELFSFEDINKALLSQGYIETGEPKSGKDIGIDQTELMVIQKKYISPGGEVTTLDFPLEKKNKYYMTLFTEKFTAAKQDIKEKMLRKLRMASK